MKETRVSIASTLVDVTIALLNERNNLGEYSQIDCAISCIRSINQTVKTLLIEEKLKKEEEEGNE